MTPRVRTALVSVIGFVVAFAAVLSIRAVMSDDGDTDALTVTQGLDAPSDTDIIVRGYLFFEESIGPLLCSHRSSDDPPICEGSVFRIEQLDPNRIDLIRPDDTEGVYDAYSEDSVVLLGRKLGAVLVVEDVLR